MLEKTLSKKDIKNLYDVIITQNEEYIALQQSREYRMGSFLCRLLYCIKKGKIKSVLGYIRNLYGRKRLKVTARPEDGQQIKYTDEDYFLNDRIAVYTSIFGGYDAVREPLFRPNNIDYYIITDQTVPNGSMWKRLDVTLAENLTDSEKNRYVKMHPDVFFSEYRYSIYVDGSIKIISDLTPMITRIGESGIAVHRHSQRCCVYEELEATIVTHKLTNEKSKEYNEFLRAENMPPRYGLCECGVIAREHNNPLCKKIMEEWWEQFLTRIKRDQLSFPYVLFKNGIEVDSVAILGGNIYKNSAFRVNQHS